MKKIILILVLSALAMAWWSSLDESQKRYYMHLAKQAPDLPYRYFA